MCGLEPVYSVNGTYDYTKWKGSYGKFCDYDRPDVSKHYKVGNLYSEYLYPSVKMNYEANGFRLPLKDEWELAAKGGKNYAYSGSDDIYEVAWFEANSNSRAQPVGTEKANDYGLYDMTGNAPEWIYDKRDSVGGDASSNADYCTLKYYEDKYYFTSNEFLTFGLRLFRTVVKESE